jgi:crotonobetainyl-CoA:carnitine CoA-transferase CaiB-like acyl-CoA transferase
MDMEQDGNKEMMLTGYRVLDLTDEKGMLCGKMLGDLGADVIKIERPGGDVSRNIGPFYKDTPHPEKSLFWFAFNANKRGITLNIENADGRGIFRDLVGKADFVIESFPPGYLKNLGLSYQDLSRLNSRVILVSITPFGQEGPYKDYKASDLSLMAMGGFMYLNGDADCPPVRISFPQSYFLASAEAAVGALMALHGRKVCGGGQHVDVSIQQGVALSLLNAPRYWNLNGIVPSRIGPNWFRAGRKGIAIYPLIYRCKDGFVSFLIFYTRLLKPLVDWMTEVGMVCSLVNTDWETFDVENLDQKGFDAIARDLAQFFSRFTKEELYEGAHKRHILLMPVSDIEDVARNRQLAAREFWTEVEHPELGDTIRYPGAFVKASETPVKIRRQAPLIGEHNEEIYVGELGISGERLLFLKQTDTI